MLGKILSTRFNCFPCYDEYYINNQQLHYSSPQFKEQCQDFIEIVLLYLKTTSRRFFMHEKTRLARGLLFVIILIVFTSACKSEPIPPTPTEKAAEPEWEPIRAEGTFICEIDECVPGEIYLEFDPNGGPVTGGCNWQMFGKIYRGHLDGKVFIGNQLGGTADLVGAGANETVNWSADFSDGVITGHFNPEEPGLKDIVLDFTLTY